MTTYIHKPRRTVLKQELIELTGHYIAAAFLNQFIYWSGKTRDYDLFLKEEAERSETPINIHPRNGWIYKNMTELVEEVQIGMDPKTQRKHMDHLLKNRWLFVRQNPKSKVDRTLQYRPNLEKINADLIALGWPPAVYLCNREISHMSKHAIREISPLIREISPLYNEQRLLTEITKDDISVKSEKIEKMEQPTASAFSKELVYMTESWNETAEETGLIPINLVSLPQKTKTLAVQFCQQYGEEGWGNLLKLIADSPWLSGENKDGFKACFGWVLNPTNSEKIITGKYKKFDYTKRKTFPPVEPEPFNPKIGLFPVPDGFLGNYQWTGTCGVSWNSQTGGWYDFAQNEWIARDRDTDWVRVQKDINNTIPLAQMPPTRVSGGEMNNSKHI